jgi:hypothetical protein
MQTKFFTYGCYSVADEGARLVGYYDKDFKDRAPAIIIKGTDIKQGDEVELAFVNHPATTNQILGIEK